MKNVRFLICCGLALLSLLCSASAFARAGLVQFASGEVSIWKRGGGESAAQKGSELYEGDTVVTGRSSSAQLLMVDGGLISLRADTRLVIESYHTGSGKSGDKALLNLVKGAMRSVTGSIGREKKADYSLRTETATIGIRGTDHETVFIPRPGSGERAPAEPGTYDKVNTGATVMEARSGRRLNVDQGETGFIGYDNAAPPKKVPDLPDYLRQSDNRPPPPPRDAARPAASKRLQVTVRFDSRPDAAINPAARSNSVASSRSDDVIEQRLQVQEGASAFVSYEQTRPGERSVTVSPFTKSVGEGRPQTEAASGFEVRPTLTASGVSMAISGRRISAGRTGQSASSNETFSTTLTARLGEWVELASRLTGGGSAAGEVTTSSRSVGANRDRVIWLRVDEAGR